MTITLTPEIEKRLIQEAQRQGTAPETLALDAIQERFGRDIPEEDATDKDFTETEAIGTAYDLFAGRIGRIHGSYEALSQNTGEQFTEYVVKKREEGHL